MQRLIAAFTHSIRALRHLLRNEIAFRQEAMAFIAAVPLAYLLGDTLEQFLLLLVVIVMVMIVEVFNTALESVCDAITLERDDNIRLAKDCGSLAVLLSLAVAGAVWALAFLNWLF